MHATICVVWWHFRLSRDTGDIMVSSYRVGIPYSYISTGCYHKLFWYCKRRLLFASEISFFSSTRFWAIDPVHSQFWWDLRLKIPLSNISTFFVLISYIFMMHAGFQVRAQCTFGNCSSFSVLVCALPLSSLYCWFQSSSGDVPTSKALLWFF